MSLRWKLFRFLSVSTVLDATAGKELHDSYGDSTLLPALSTDLDHELQSKQRLLRRFATSAERALHTDSVDGVYVLSLPRGVVQLFHLGAIDQHLSLTVPLPYNPIPSHYTFSAHESSVVAACIVRHKSAPLPSIVTLGDDDGYPMVKVWCFKVHPSENTAHTFSGVPSAYSDSLSNINPDDNKLECVAAYRLPADSSPTVLAVQDAKVGVSEIREVAVGFADGSVTILSGDISDERAVRARVAPAPGEMIEARPIVFAEYCKDVLYCVSEMSVVVIVSLPADPDAKKASPTYRREILDNLGCSNRELCCTLEDSDELVVAKEEALYFFNREGRGPCLAFPTKGDRPSISSIGNYLVHSTGPGSITAYDVVNKLIAFRGKGSVTCAFQSHTLGYRNGVLCISDGSILRLSEISLEERVNMLLKRGLYVPAVALAKAESALNGGESNVMLTRALRQYAEYLMSKNRYDDAAEQLVETIGHNVEPSWVITRLVEQSGLRSGLRLYLEALHAAGKAAFVHTKVLITCYRHDRARGRILGSKAAEKTTDEYVINVFSDVDWSEEQVDAAIKLCRDAGLYKVAERVARRRGRYVQLAQTLVEDLNETEKVLELLRSLQDEDAVAVIKSCERNLLVKDPVNFVHYLSDAISRSTSMMPLGNTEPVLQLSDFLPMFIDMPRWRAVLLERILGSTGGVTATEVPKAWILLFESLVCVDVAERLRPERLAITAKPSDEDARPELYGLSENGKADDQRSLTLSESSAETRERSAETRERRVTGRRALKILQSRRSVIDLKAALLIAEQFGHGPCLEYLYEHLRMYRDLGVCLRMSENGASLLRACRRHGDREPRLWIECIRLYAPLAAKEEYGNGGDAGEENGVETLAESPPSRMLVGVGTDLDMREGSIRGILSSVSEAESERGSAQDIVDEAMIALGRSGLLSPVEIIDVVTEACPDAAWGVVREYFERCTTGLRRDAAISEHSGLLLEAEVQELQKEVHRLGEETVVIKRGSCASCEDAISVPAVHFFCDHSYHASCLAPGGGGDSGGGGSGSAAYMVVGGVVDDGKSGMWGEECPKCAPELDAMVSMRQALQDKNGRHDEFFRTLREAKDGFATVIEFLERSPFI